MLLLHWLRPEIPGIAGAFVMAFILGIISSVITTLVGPSIQVISAPAEAILEFEKLLGPRIGVWAARLAGGPAMAAGDFLAVLPMALVILAGAKALLGLAQWFLWERAGEKASLRIRREIVGAWLSVAPAHRSTPDGREREAEIGSTLTNDIRLLREYIVHFYGGMPRELIQFVMMLATLFLLSPKLTVIFFLAVLPAVAAIQSIGRKIRRRAAAALKDFSGLTEWLQQRLMGAETIKHYRTEEIETAKMQELSEDLTSKYFRAARTKARTSPALELVSILALAGVLVIALGDVATGAATGSVQMSFFATLALLSQSGGKLGRYYNSNREGSAAISRIFGLLGFFRASPPWRGVLTAVAANGRTRLICDGIAVRYEGAGQDAIAGFSKVFEAGKIYCLAGPSGAGKSTVFNLLLGLVNPRQGSFQAEITATHPLPVCYMPQKVLLAPDTVAANVAYPFEPEDRDRIAAALDKVGMRVVVEGLPQGQDTLVGSEGSGLSGGQAQRILLARIWYHQSPIVLFDEGTSALDPEVEKLVHDLLRDLARAGSIVITIAHRSAAVALADEVILMDHGRIAASGAPQALRQNPLFLSLTGH